MADKNREFWKWPESVWKNPDIDLNEGKCITVGIDVGSVSTQCVFMVDGELLCFSNMRTGSNSPESAVKAFNKAAEVAGLTLKDVNYTVGTGYGRVNVPFGNRAITEIACHAKGANWMYGPSVRTVLDMGGQDCKAIKVDEKGKVRAFLMNDKCAAGTGRGIEVFADLLGVPVQDVGDMSLNVSEELPSINSTCVVYAKSEATALLNSGWPKKKVLAAYCSAMADRVLSLLEKVNVEEGFAITGGIAKNRGIVVRISKGLDVKLCETKWHNKSYADRGVPFDTQIAGAIGAALFGKALFEKMGR